MSTPTNILTNFFISNTYEGLLHANGTPLPGTGRVPIYTGAGQETALTLGVAAGGGLTVNGGLTVGTLIYPTIPAATNSIAVMVSNTTLGFVPKLNKGYFENSGVTGKVYDNINTVTVDSSGLITNITEFDDSNGVVITSTRYFNGQIVQNPSFIIQGNEDTDYGPWTGAIQLSNEYKTAKAGIFFLGPNNSDFGGQSNTLSRYIVSPDKSRIFYANSITHPDNDDGIGSQFCCPIGGAVGSDNRYLYFRRYNETDDGSPFEAELFGIAAQQ